MDPVIFLFDLDGVMVQPLGYRAAVRATIDHFTHRMGLPDMAPNDDTLSILEAQGITCEWDMIPIALSILFEEAAARQGSAQGMGSLAEACEQVRALRLEDLKVDYAPVFRRLGAYAPAGIAPADALLNLCEQGGCADLFPRLAGRGVLRDLLSNTRRPAQSEPTRLFETYVLGDRVFSESMQMVTEVQSPSLLAHHDRPLLSQEGRACLEQAAQVGARMAVYTARPSLPSRLSEERLAVFAPEAEMALDLVGIRFIPLVGSGQMGELALRLGEHEDRLTKPAPYHALAAILAAWLGDRSAALDWVGRVFRALEGDELVSAVEMSMLPPAFSLHVFEDSPAGMRGGIEAARILAGLGAKVQTRLWGVSEHPEKRAALSAVGASLFDNINQAAAAALAESGFSGPAK